MTQGASPSNAQPSASFVATAAVCSSQYWIWQIHRHSARKQSRQGVDRSSVVISSSLTVCSAVPTACSCDAHSALGNILFVSCTNMQSVVKREPASRHFHDYHSQQNLTSLHGPPARCLAATTCARPSTSWLDVHQCIPSAAVICSILLRTCLLACACNCAACHT